MAKDTYILGESLAFEISLKYLNLTMDDYDFDVSYFTVFSKTVKPIVIPKSELIRVDPFTYCVYIDTLGLLPGDLNLVITARIPNIHFRDNTEIKKISFTPCTLKNPASIL